jgi:hypothetical protein
MEGADRTDIEAALLLVVIIAAGVGTWIYREPFAQSLRRFFTEPSGPLNLAITRIVFFGSTLVFAPPITEVRGYADLGDGLRFPPGNFGELLTHIPITDTLIVGAYVVFLVSGLLALVGLCTRPAAAMFVLSGFYYLGVPQLFGKVNHYHHIIWVGLIFAVARSADTLSVSAIRRRVKPEPSLAYSLPLRFLWLFMGLIYLFAGLSKYRFLGPEWVSAETGRYWMHLLWWQSGHDPPLFEPDRFAPLISLGTAFTLVFECTFILLVLFKRTRLLAVLAGLAFHNMTWFTLGISFVMLQALYVSLIDWEALLSRVAKRRAALHTNRGSPGTGHHGVRTVAAVGCSVVVILVAIGIYGLRDTETSRTAVNGWPFATYPPFASRGGDTARMLRLRVRAGDSWEPLDLRRALGFLPYERYFGLINSIHPSITSEAQYRRALEALVAYTGERRPVAIWEDKVSIDSAMSGEVLESQRLLVVNR